MLLLKQESMHLPRAYVHGGFLRVELFLVWQCSQSAYSVCPWYSHTSAKQRNIKDDNLPWVKILLSVFHTNKPVMLPVSLLIS